MTQTPFEFRPPRADDDLSSSAAPPALFDPPDAAQVLADLADPAHSLLSIASKYGITVEQLTLWMAEPSTADALARLHSAGAIKARVTASVQLTRAVPVLLTILAAFQDEESNQYLAPTPATAALRARQRTVALRAVSTLLRLSGFTPHRLILPAPDPGPPAEFPAQGPVNHQANDASDPHKPHAAPAGISEPPSSAPPDPRSAAPAREPAQDPDPAPQTSPFAPSERSQSARVSMASTARPAAHKSRALPVLEPPRLDPAIRRTDAGRTSSPAGNADTS